MKGIRIQIPTNPTIEGLLREHQDAMRVRRRSGTQEIAETALRHSYAYGKTEDPTFSYDGARRDLTLFDPAFLGPPPSLLGSYLQRELLDFDERWAANSTSLTTVQGRREEVTIFLPDDTLWKIRVNAFHKGVNARAEISRLVRQSLLEMQHVYRQAGVRYVEVPVELPKGTFASVASVVEKAGGHPEFALSHHVSMKVELGWRRS